MPAVGQETAKQASSQGQSAPVAATASAASSSPGSLKYEGVFALTLHKATDLKNVQLIGKMDPYVKIVCGSEEFKSKVHKNGGQNPVWDQAFALNLDGKSDQVQLRVKDEELIGGRDIARVDIPIPELVSKIQAGGQQAFQLVDVNNFKMMAGTIYISGSYSPAPGSAGYVTAAPVATAPAPAPAVSMPTVVVVSSSPPPSVSPTPAMPQIVAVPLPTTGTPTVVMTSPPPVVTATAGSIMVTGGMGMGKPTLQPVVMLPTMPTTATPGIDPVTGKPTSIDAISSAISSVTSSMASMSITTTAITTGINYQAFCHPHPLQDATHSSPRSCDVCKVGHIRTYICRMCNYDECPNCYPRTRSHAGPAINYSAFHHAHPLQDTTHSSPRSCDVCKVANIRTYVCRACNYDECPSCFPRTQSRAGASIDFQAFCHAHPLVDTTHSSPRSCDVCKVGNTRTYICRMCNYDECPNCFPRTRSQAGSGMSTGINYSAFCHPHPLQDTTHSVGRSCDVCKVSNIRTYICRMCNYDECPNCFPRTRSQAGPAAAPSINYQAFCHAHPLQDATHSVPRSCDVCKIANIRTYICRMCNYDECPSCFPRTRSQAGAAAAPSINYQAFCHPHPLVDTQHGVGRSCDVCKVSNTRTYICRACNYDECPSCFPRTRSQAGTGAPNYSSIRHPHGLQEMTLKGSVTHLCNVCRQHTQHTFFCAMCNYDECQNCFPRTQSTRA